MQSKFNIYPFLLITISIGLLLFTSSLQAQDPDQNYIYVKQYRVDTTQSIANPNPTQASESVQYFDGLGRPIQQIAKGQSPSEHDIISLFTYDEYGRQTKEYLPYVDSDPTLSDRLWYRPNLDEQAIIDYYTPLNSNMYGADADFPYSERSLEVSPLNRPLEQGVPGVAWQVDKNADTDHTIKFDYQTNAALEVKRFEVEFTDTNTTVPHMVLDKGYYAANQLYKNITKDENWQPGQPHPKDHTTEEFKNKLGQVILKRTYDKNIRHDTYYVYDDYGNLSYVFSPELSKEFTTSSLGLTSTTLLQWTSVAKVDQNLAAAYERALQNYDDDILVHQDLFQQYGGQGGLSIDVDPNRELELSFNMTLANPMPLKNGVIYDLKNLGSFRDTELGRIRDQAYDYLFYIENNTIKVQGTGKLTSINTSMHSSTRIDYQKFYPWYHFIDMSRSERLQYERAFDLLPTGTDLSTAVINNPYGAVGGVQLEVNADNSVNFVMQISTTSAVALRKDLALDIQIQRPLEDRYLANINTSNSDYTISLKNNQLSIEGSGTQMGVVNQPPYLAYSATKFPDQVSNSLIHGLGYIYRYDNRNNLVEKKIPGKDWEHIVYDHLDRPILTQDGNMRQQDQWLFTKYNAFGRVTYTGMYTNNADRETLQATAYQTTTNLNETKTDQGSSFTTDGNLAVYYTNNAFPNTNLEIYTVNYYDDYDFDQRGISLPTVSNYTTNLNNGNFTNHTKTLSTGSHVRVLETDDWITSITQYDDKARPIYSHTKNEYLSSETNVHTKLNFIGEVLETTTTHDKSGTNTNNISIVDKFTYDHAGRMLKQTQNIDNQGEELIVFNEYDELGQLIEKKVGGSDTNATSFQNATALQNIDYNYNIRGWLTQINDVETQDPSKLFAFELKYNNPEPNNNTTPLYNGNISETHWRTQNTQDEKRSYSYAYDALNRIKKADYLTQHAMTGDFSGNENYGLDQLSYDRNGNIMGLRRYGAKQNNSIGIIDQLDYTYQPQTNQLKAVNDRADEQGFKSGTHSEDYDYSYDVNGNMVEDKNKDIVLIEYNHLNLPTKIRFKYDPNELDANKIEYVYDATGIKLQKKVSRYHSGNNLNTATTDYDGGFIYKTEGNYSMFNGNPLGNNLGLGLQFFSHPEGYVEPNGSNYDYVYQYKDHLGNIRLSYKDNNGNLEIVEENNYYPFGLQHKGYNENVTSSNLALKRKYNGIELEDALGLDFYEMYFRLYDPAIARWNSIDPVIHYEYSTYSAFDNNPVFWADPSGANSEVSEDGNTITLTGQDAQDFFKILQNNESSNESSESNSNSESGSNCPKCKSLLDWYNWFSENPDVAERYKGATKQMGIGIHKGALHSVNDLFELSGGDIRFEITKVTKEQNGGYFIGMILFALLEPSPGGELRLATKSSITGFNALVKQLPKAGQQNVRILQNWAKSKGFVKGPNSGGPQVWGVYDNAGNFSWRLKIKAQGSMRQGLEAGSRVPRFDARLGPGNYVNPFTGQTGGKVIGTHLPLY